LTDVKESYNSQVISLFKYAHDKLDKIDKEANEKKRDIVIKLAKDLEDKIPKDSICKKIVEELDGKVSDTLIRDCLPEEYKNKRLSNNAKKQKKKQIEKEETKLAPQVVLNQQECKEVEAEEKQHKDKVVVMVGADGQSYIQIGDQNKSSNTESEDHVDYTSKDNAFDQSFSNSRQQLEQDNLIEEDADHLDNELKDVSYNASVNSASEDLEQPLEEQQQLTVDVDKIVEDNNVKPILDSNILHFKSFRTFKFVQNHLSDLISMFGFYGQVCFEGDIDKRNGKVIYFEMKGQNHQHQKQPGDENINRD